VIDLHLHTTASDGRLAPAALIALAARSGVRVAALTDHDTVAGFVEAQAAARAMSIRLVSGIEITSVERGRDVHVLGYFFDPNDTALGQFLVRQRLARIERIREIGARLHALGMPVDVEDVLAARSSEGKSVGRPAVADALVDAGFVADRNEAFDRWLGQGCPAFVARCGPSLAEAAAVVRAAGGIASLAHPGPLAMDEDIPAFAEQGLTALEARHRDHDEPTEARYRAIAARLGLVISGGSDFHGEHERSRRGTAARPGDVGLTTEEFQALESRLGSS
jgi:predicted metal-dependent phosphoesterase TrpH